ncbi:MAG: LysR substrate-binding domain-containing protein [Burkholderiales bacterium]
MLRGPPRQSCQPALGQHGHLKLAEPQGPIFSDSSMVVQAAVDGRGIALVRRSIAEGDLAAGTLVRLFEVAIPAPGSYYLVRPQGPAPQKVLAFRAWMLEEKKRKR